MRVNSIQRLMCLCVLLAFVAGSAAVAQGPNVGSIEKDWTAGDSTKKTQSPTTALFKSLAVPGWGQISNRQYVKAGVVIAAEGIFLYRWMDLRQQTAEARKDYEAIPLADTARSSTRASLFRKFQDKRYDRNLYAWLTGFTIFLSMFDAYVDAHLSQFPKKSTPQISVDFGPEILAHSESRALIATQITFSW